MSARASNGPPLSPKEAWLSDGRQVLHFRPSRWDRWSQRLQLSREEARKVWADKRKQGWQPTTAQWQSPQAPAPGRS